MHFPFINRLVWSFSISHLFPQILGFGPSGAPILPHTSNSFDPDAIRREKLGWEEISVQAAKIVSFIGRLWTESTGSDIILTQKKTLLVMNDI
jgi:hypothetical protein